MCITEIGRISLYQSSVLSGFENLVHGFTTRRGGVSTGEYASMSLSPRRGDDISCIHQNEEILCKELGLDVKKLTSTRQEHTSCIEVVGAEKIGIGVYRDWGKGVDGCITTERGVPLICYSADCVPVLMYARDIGAIAAVHAGWRGTQDKITEKCVGKLISLGADAKNIFGAIGPCIGKCCYEVSEDVALQFDEKYFVPKENGKYMLDLETANFDQFIAASVPQGNVSISGICTKCNNEMFFSHRGQNGKSGTLGGIICMK